MRLFPSCIALSVLLGCAFPAIALAAADFQGLGDLPGGTYSSRAYAVTNTRVVAGESMSANGQEAYRWTAATGMQPLGDFSSGTFGSAAKALNADGSVLGGFSTPASGTVATLFDMPGPVLTTLGSSPSYTPTWINGMSADGNVVGGFSAFARPFRFSNTTGLQQIPDFPGGGAPSNVMAVSSDGSTVVGYGNSAAGMQAFRHTQAGGMQGLGDLPGGDFQSQADDVSADGSVIVGFSSAAPYGTQAFRWTAASGMVGLPMGPGSFYPRHATAVSDDGKIIVGSGSYVVAPFSTDPFIWDPVKGTQNLRMLLIARGANLTGWSGLYVQGISPDGGTIVGYGQNPSGAYEAFIATIPEPGTAGALAAVGTAAFLRRRRGLG